MSNKALSHKLALFKAVLMLIRCLVIACHAEGQEKQVTTWNPQCKREQGPAPRAALDPWTVGKGFTAGETSSCEPFGGEGTLQAGHSIFSAEDTFQQGGETGIIKKDQRTRTTQLEIEPLTTTWTSTQQPESRQLYCFTKLVLLLFHI